MIQRNIVFQSKTDTGESVLNMPITVLKNIEDTAEIKDNISDDDYVPVIDSSDNSQMKKIKFKNAMASKADKADVESALENKSDVTHTHDERYYTESEVDTKLSVKLDSTLKGIANGIAELNENGKVPSSQLPSYVDAVVEYTSISDFPTTGDTGKIYVDTTTNLTYRWSGSAYVEISPSIALGETSSTAYRGDRGKEAYDHISDTTAHITAAERTAWNAKAETDTATSTANGLMSAADKKKLDGIATGAETNVQSDWNIADENSDAYIKNKPESLPANGGNADTVDGLHAKEITSNSNLLINPDFKINQRGATTYTGKGYTVDRWFNSTDYTVSTITDNGIKIGMINPSGGTSNTTIGQIGTNLEPETVNLLKGKTITFSINVTELTAVGAKMMIFERNERNEPTYTTVKIASTGINTCKTTIKNDTTKIDVRIYGVDARIDGEAYTNYTTVQWAKLEVGSFPTIFTPPDSATELLKCQRYYQKISGLNNHFCSGFIAANYIAATIINLPTSLNKKPTVVLNGNIY